MIEETVIRGVVGFRNRVGVKQSLDLPIICAVDVTVPKSDWLGSMRLLALDFGLWIRV